MKIIFIFLLILIKVPLLAQNTIIEPIDTLDVQLSINDVYSKSDVNDKYYVFFNLSKKTLNIYSLENRSTKSVTLIKGRGPSEYLSISDLIIDNDNDIYLVDSNGFKFLKYDIEGQFLYSISHNITSFVESILENEKGKYIQTMTDLILGSLYHEIYLNNEEIQLKSISKKEFDPNKVNSKNYYAVEGISDINKNQIVHLHKYQSKVSVYPLSNDSELYSFYYDDSIPIIENRLINKESKESILLPPTEVMILSNELFIHPKDTNLIYINALGETQNKSYYLDEIYQYDLSKRAFTGTFELGFIPESVARNRELVYILPDLQKSDIINCIFVYKIK